MGGGSGGFLPFAFPLGFRSILETSGVASPLLLPNPTRSGGYGGGVVVTGGDIAEEGMDAAAAAAGTEDGSLHLKGRTSASKNAEVNACSPPVFASGAGRRRRFHVWWPIALMALLPN